MSDDFGAAVVDAASAVDSTPAVDSTATVDTPSTDSTTTNNDADLQVIDASSEETTEDEVAGKETATHNVDGSEKTPEQVEDFKAKAENRAPLPAEVRSALKSLRDSAPDDPKVAAAVKTLHGSYERYEAIKPLLGTGGVNQLKSVLEVAGVKNVGELQQTIGQNQTMIDTVKATDQLLYSADPVLAANVFADMEANGAGDKYAAVVNNFISHLKEADPTGYYDEVSKPILHSALEEVGMRDALYGLQQALLAGDVDKAKAVMGSIGKWYNQFSNEMSDKGKLEKALSEREKQLQEKESVAQRAERTKVESGTAEEADRANNLRLGKALGGFLKMPFFKDFPRPSLVDLGNSIKANLYTALKNDKAYQTSMKSLFAAKTLDRAKVMQVHNAKLEEIADRVVRDTVQLRFPGYAKGGSSAGKAAAATAKKADASKAASTSVATGRPIYVASRPENLIRSDVKIGGKLYTASDLQTLQITGKGFVRTTDGKGVKFVSWRKN